MLSRCPLYFNHGPAIEIWSVVHFPYALIRSLAPVMFLPSHGSNGSNNCNLSDVGETATSTLEPSSAGAIYPGSSTSNPNLGSSSPFGSSRRTISPSLFLSLSFSGLKVKSPAIAKAVTNSGEPTKA